MVIGPQHTGNSNYGFCHVLFSDYLFDTIIFGPVRPTFTTYQFFVTIPILGLTDSFCITNFLYHTEYSHGGTGKCVYLSVFFGFILSFLIYFMEIYKSCALQE
jgi:sec-independent protein translocase protein TatC